MMIRAFSTLLCSSCLKACAAVNRSVVGGLEVQLCFAAAFCAGCDEILTLGLACVLLSIAASLAALGLVHKAFFLVECLLAGCEYEFIAAIFANQRFVNVFFFYYFFCYYLSLVVTWER